MPVVPDAAPVWAPVYIYTDLQGNAGITNVYELYIDRRSMPADWTGNCEKTARQSV